MENIFYANDHNLELEIFLLLCYDEEEIIATVSSQQAICPSAERPV